MTLADGLPPELSLVALCSSWPPTEASDRQIAEVSTRVGNWNRFEELVNFHRVRPLVHQSFERTETAAPVQVREKLAAASLAASRQSLMLAHESVRLQALFTARGLKSLILKGASVAALCFPSVAMKEAWDIDLLVESKDASLAREILLDAGYEIQHPDLTTEQFGIFIQFAKEAAFTHPESGTTVELHWRLLDTSGAEAFLAKDLPVQNVTLPFGTLRTLSDEPLFSYLALHGAAHNWFRLKWLADFRAFVAKRTEDELVSLYEAAERHGAQRSISVALALIQQLFLVPLDRVLSSRLDEGLIARILQANVQAGLGYKGDLEGKAAQREVMLRSVAASFVTNPSWRHLWRNVAFYWSNAADRARFNGAASLYHFVRLPVFAVRVSKRMLTSVSEWPGSGIRPR